LSLPLAFTSAPFSSSAFTHSVWPFCDAPCSAVFLQCSDTLTHEPNGAQPSRRVQPTPVQYKAKEKDALVFALGVHVCALLEQRLPALRVAVL
jgi:hypothetical protein